MIDLLRAAGVQRSLTELGVVTEEQLRWCIDHVTGASDVDPCYTGPETVAQIFLSARALGC